jgi:hypothetical protein
MLGTVTCDRVKDGAREEGGSTGWDHSSPATLSDVTVVTLDLTLYSPHEWRSPGDKDTELEHLCGRLSRCEEEPK